MGPRLQPRSPSPRRPADDQSTRAIFLAAASQALASSLDYQQTLKTVARLAIPRFADWSVVHLRQADGSIERTAIAHRDADRERALVEWCRQNPFEPDADDGIPHVLRSGQPGFYPVFSRQHLAAWTDRPDARSAMEAAGLRSMIIAPLKPGHETLGAVSFVRGPGRPPFRRADLKLAEDLSRRAAIAVEHARLYDALRRRQRLDELTQEAFRVEQAQTAYALQAARAGVWSGDLQQGLITWTESMAAVHGTTMARCPGTLDAYIRLVHPEDRQALIAVIERARSTGSPRQNFTYELRVVWPDGSVHWLECAGQLLEGGLMRGVAIDITARKELERRFHHAQKFETLGRLTGGIAHDFTNVLSAIIGYTEVILLQVGETDPVRSDLHEVQAAADRAVGLTRQLLAFGRQQAWQPRVVNVNLAVSKLAALLTRVLGGDVELRLMLSPSVDPIRVDPGQFEQVLMNLAINARDAMPGGGCLTIETGTWGADAGRSTLISVRDTGTGMDEATQAAIFEPFFTTKGEAGTGLGLSTVRDILDRCDGRITVSSQLDQGTTFQIYLPVAPMACLAEPKPRESPRRVQSALVVDDDELVRKLLVRLLKQQGLNVSEAGTAARALALAAEMPSSVDLVITDIVMPHVSGLDLAANMRAIYPNVRVIFMTGQIDTPAARQLSQHPGEVLIQKPFTSASVAEAVRAVEGEWPDASAGDDVSYAAGVSA